MIVLVLPYMAISFVIGWAIFAPFAKLENLRDWTFSRIELSDLFATFLPLSLLFAAASWTVPPEWFSFTAWLLTIGSFIILAACGLAAGLFLLAKIEPTSVPKRMALIGLVVPIGSFLTLAWMVIPTVALNYSALYAIPATLAIIPIAWGLRKLGRWACWETQPTA